MAIGNAIVKPKERMDTLKRLLEEARPSMAAVIPRHLTPERLIKIALVAASKTPTLLECDSGTILQSVMNAAQLGLDCGGALGSAYLVPFKNGKTGKMECQLIVGYRGFIELARRSGEIQSIEARVVKQNDIFELAYGFNPVLRHVPLLTGERGKPVLVYAIAKLKDGGSQFEVMTLAEVEHIRAKSRMGNAGAWVSDYEEMMKKTAIRRLAKMLPLSIESQDAITKADALEGMEGVIDINPITIEELPEPPSKSDQIAANVTKPDPTDQALFDERQPGEEG